MLFKERACSISVLKRRLKSCNYLSNTLIKKLSDEKGFMEGVVVDPDFGVVLVVARIRFMAKGLLVFAAKNAGPRRTAIRMGYIAVGTADSPLGQPVDMGRGEVEATIATQIPETEVIGHDDDDVRFFLITLSHILATSGVGKQSNEQADG